MPRTLTFKLKRKEYAAVPVKVDRKKLYGWTEIVALDEQDRPCKLVTTDESGIYIIPRGGTAIGILSPTGEWVDRSTLKTVTDDGSEAKKIASSFTVTIQLKEKVTPEEYLNHSITDFYELNDAPDELIKAIGTDIYTFGYTYLDSYETTPAFLMVSDGILFLLLGYRNRFDLLCLGDCEKIDEDDDDFIDVTEDDIDFSML